jgi:hypothetical protein
MERLVIGGLLVGFGTKKGNGCTSGHGVCGLSSLRLRSLVATCSFMMTAFVTAMATNTYSYLPSFKNDLSMEHGYGTSLVVIGISMILALFAYTLNQNYPDLNTKTSHPSLSVFYAYIVLQELVFGVLFGLAMCVSNMTLLSAVISFLDLRYWNPALGFVMGGAIAIALPSFYLIFNRKKSSLSAGGVESDIDRPLLDIKFHLSKLSTIDRNLVIGASIFGIGWGLFGACPGPALVNIGSGNIPPIIYGFAIVVGMYLEYGSNLLYDQFFPSYHAPLPTSSSKVDVEDKKKPTDEILIKAEDVEDSSRFEM